MGDIGGHPKKFFEKYKLDNSTFFYHASLQKYFHKKTFLEIGLTVGKLTAADNQVKYSNVLDPEFQRYLRNLDFKTNITEFSLNYNVMPLAYTRNERLKNYFIQPFINTGVAVYSFNPMGSYYDSEVEETYWIPLQQYFTEGQGYAEYPNSKPYKLTQININYGFGVTALLGQRTRVNIGANARKLFTDYLDDVSGMYIESSDHNRYFDLPEDAAYAIYFSDKSQLINPYSVNNPSSIRGDSGDNDAYLNYYVKVGFKIRSKKSRTPVVYKFGLDEICQ